MADSILNRPLHRIALIGHITYSSPKKYITPSILLMKSKISKNPIQDELPNSGGIYLVIESLLRES